LRGVQVLGIWPSGDFRVDPGALGVTTLALAVLAVAAVAGAALAVRRGAIGLTAYGAGTLLGTAVLVARGSPWVDAKAMALASPAALLLAFAALGAGATWALPRSPGRVAAVAVGVALAAGVA